MKAQECWLGGHFLAVERGAFETTGKQLSEDNSSEANGALERHFLTYSGPIVVFSGYAVPAFKFADIARGTFWGLDGHAAR